MPDSSPQSSEQPSEHPVPMTHEGSHETSYLRRSIPKSEDAILYFFRSVGCFVLLVIGIVAMDAGILKMKGTLSGSYRFFYPYFLTGVLMVGVSFGCTTYICVTLKKLYTGLTAFLYLVSYCILGLIALFGVTVLLFHLFFEFG